jgi:protoporphyrinogen oxidase
MEKKKVTILGAGPTGLITAWRLLQKGFKVKIIEKNSTSGGLCRSWRYKDFIIDTGPHIFHTPDEELKKFWKKNFNHLLIEGKFYGKNVKGKSFDKFYDYPFSKESLEKFDKNLKLKIKSELIKCKDLTKRFKAKNYKEYIDSFVGPTLRKMFFEKYPKKIWGMDTSKMTPDWAPNRIKFRDKILPFYNEEYAAVGKYGTGCIYDDIKNKIIKLGGKFKFNETIIGLKNNDKKITEIISTKNNYIINENEIVISTLPISITSRLLGKKNNLKFRGVCSVYLFYNQNYILPKNTHWLYYDSEEVIFNRITENKRLSKFVAPKNKSFLTAEITYSINDNFSRKSSKEVMSQVINDISKVNLIDNRKLIHTQINYEPFVYPVQFMDYKSETFEIKSYIESFNNLYSIGAGGEFNYADSQILFHKSFDLVDSLSNKFNLFTNETKDINRTDFNKSFKINKKLIGNNSDPFIIAEAGLNHNGSFLIAKKLIDEAKKSKCDAIKFQSFLPDSRVSRKVKSEKYSEKIIGTQESIHELFSRLSLNFNTQKKYLIMQKKRKC